MAKKSSSLSGATSAEEVVETLLDDPKSFVMSLPGIMDDAMAALESRFYREYKANKFVNADHADDRVIEMAAEVANDYVIETKGQDFDTLLHRAFRLSRNVRPLFT